MKNLREKFNYDSKKLRRARRLYLFICAPYIQNNISISVPLSFRATKAGLWSDGTMISDVCYMLVQSVKKRFHPNVKFWDFCVTNNCEYIWFEAKKHYKKINGELTQIDKPVIMAKYKKELKQ